MKKPLVIGGGIVVAIVLIVGVFFAIRWYKRRKRINEWTQDFAPGEEQLPPGYVLTLSDSDLRRLAEKIYNAYGGWFWNDDKNAVYEAMSELNTQADFNALAAKFQEMYDEGIVDFLRSFLNENEMRTVNTILAARGIKPI